MMKDWVNRSLSRIFRRAAQRDRMLADLYVAIKLETYSDLVLQRTRKLAEVFHDSPEVAQCIGATLDYIQDAESPMRAIEMSKYLLRTVREGSVFDVILSRIGKLHFCDSIDVKTRKETAVLLNRLRQETGPDGKVLNTLFCFKESVGKTPIIYPRPDKISPAEFQRHLSR